MSVAMRMRAAAVVAAICGVGLLAACAGASGVPGDSDGQALVRVSDDAGLVAAGSQVADGGVILIAPGTYRESLSVSADDVTIRGEDRNGVVLDGELRRSNGIVATGARVAVENLTVRNFLQNGVLITGVTDETGAGVARGPDGYLPDAAPPPVPGYLVRFVTANNNGLYGIYAFNRTGGMIRDSLASGGSDSGIYVGQCEDCGAVVQDNVVVSNAVGIELANASNVTVVGNRISGNRIGVSVLSNYFEAHGPSRGVRLAGNLISDNNEAATPAQGNGAFGIGIGLAGTRDAEVRANRISGNSSAGLWVTSSEDFMPLANRIEENLWAGNTLDAVYTPAAESAGNCFRLPAEAVTVPAELARRGCADPLTIGAWTQQQAPPGMVFSKVPLPPERPGLDGVDDRPTRVPDAVAIPDLGGIAAPGEDLLGSVGG